MKTRFAIYSIIAALAFVPATVNAQISVGGVKVPTSKKAAQEQIDAKKQAAKDKAAAKKQAAQDKIDAAKEKAQGSETGSKDVIKEAKGKAADKGVEKANSALNGTGIKIAR